MLSVKIKATFRVDLTILRHMKRKRKVTMHWTRSHRGGAIEDVHDGGQISKNDDYEICLEFYSGYGKIEISAIWQKFLAPEISGRRNFCHVAEILFFPYPEFNSKQLLQLQFFDISPPSWRFSMGYGALPADVCQILLKNTILESVLNIRKRAP